MNEAAAHSTPGALEEGRRGASGQWWSVDFYYSYSRGRMVTHARARVFCSLKGTGFMELRISTDSTDQPTFARPPFPSAHPFRSSRSRFGRYAPTRFAVPRLGTIAVLQRLIPSRSAASVSTSSEHQRSRIALSRLKQAARGSPQTRRRNLFLAIGAISFFKIEPFPALRLPAPVGTGSSARRWLIGHLCTSTAGPLLAGWGLLNNHSVRAGAEASGGCRD